MLPPTLVAILMIFMSLATLLVPWPPFVWPVRLVGLPILAAGLILNMRHARLFAQIDTNIKTFNDPETLVRHGAFRWTRNPMYLGFTLLLAGLALMLGTAIACVGPLAFFVAADRWYIPFEEERMTAVFGVEYADYRREVHRWIGSRSTQ